MIDRRVVVTGIGALTPIGNNLEDYWKSLVGGVSGAAPITHFDASNFKTKFACEIKGFNPIDFIEKKEMKNAALAITKMAALLRSTLDNMNEKLVSFESEYKICDNYMYLESLRFSKKFEYKFKPLEGDVVKQWFIPPGIIEPLLENAVNHAFKGVDYKGLIELNHEISQDHLMISVSDNGIGIGTSNVVRKIDEVEKVIEESYNKFGKVDCLVNNAAGNFISPTERLSTRAFDAVIDIVLKGTINFTLTLGKKWIKEKKKWQKNLGVEICFPLNWRFGGATRAKASVACAS